MTPFFSVIVPVYNVEPYLRECADSILAQTFPDFEMILVDDGSPDGCPAICDGYAAKDPRVSVIHRPNGGLAQARLSGLKQAKADYVCFVDSDDYVTPDWLETVHALIEQYDPDLVIHGYVRKMPDGRIVPEPQPPAPGCFDRERLEREIFPYMVSNAPGEEYGMPLFPAFLCTKPGKRELYLRYYLKDERIRTMEDMPMMYEVIYHAQSVVFSDAPLYIYRKRDGSILSGYNAKIIPALRLSYEYMASHLGAESEQLRHQCDKWLLRHLFWVVRDECRLGRSAWQTARNLRIYCRQAHPLRGVPLAREPLRIRLYMRLLRLRLYLPLVLITRFFMRFVWTYEG